MTLPPDIDLRVEIARLHQIIRVAGEEAKARQELIDLAVANATERGRVIDKITATLLTAQLLVKRLRALP